MQPNGKPETAGKNDIAQTPDGFSGRPNVDDMVAEIAEDAKHTGDYTGKTQFGDAVMQAMRRVPRHLFVPPTFRAAAYENRPLPIGGGQTISQPYIVALMTDLAQVAPGDKVLEVGTGCGYQAAVLAELGAAVYSIERLDQLVEQARENLKEAGYAGIRLRHGDGAKGWPEEAPFDAILVTAAAERMPQSLIEQLAPGGRLVVPVERRGGFARFDIAQELVVVTKSEDGEVSKESVLPVAFVPLIESRN